ncbi:MAG: hypothetical protein R2769_09225 [Saprospiraceae bacterium]
MGTKITHERLAILNNQKDTEEADFVKIIDLRDDFSLGKKPVAPGGIKFNYRTVGSRGSAFAFRGSRFKVRGSRFGIHFWEVHPNHSTKQNLFAPFLIAILCD